MTSINIPHGVKAPKYADDILAYDKNKQLNQETADAVQKWTVANLMRLNIEKTQYLVFNEKNSSSEPITINGNEITTTNSYKYLGTVLTNNLSWKEHWNNISKKFNSTMFLLKSMRQLGFSKKVMVTTYKSLILGQIISNAHTLCSANKETLEEINNIQNRALKIINIKNNNNNSNNVDYKIINTDELIDKYCIKRLNNIIENENHPVTKSLIKKENINKTRQKFPFKIKKCRTNTYENSFVQKYLRILESGNNNTNNTDNKSPLKEKTNEKNKIKTECELCGKFFISIKIHKAKTHKNFEHNYSNVTIRS